MQHLLVPRGPIDPFEQTLINAFSSVRTVEAIWVREVRALARDEMKRFTRVVWLQLRSASFGDRRQIKDLADELVVRVTNQPFGLEIRCVVDDLPPADIAPSCIYRRGSGRV